MHRREERCLRAVSPEKRYRRRPWSPVFYSDADRIKRLLTTHLAALTRHVERLGVPSAEVDDVAQEAFLVAATKIDGVPFEQRARLPLRRRDPRRAERAPREDAAASGVRAVLGRRGRSGPLARGDDGPRPRAGFLVDSVLRGMSPELRGIFLLCEVEGLAVPEIARRLALPTGTAASRLRRAREAFFERFTRASVPPRQRAAAAPSA